MFGYTLHLSSATTHTAVKNNSFLRPTLSYLFESASGHKWSNRKRIVPVLNDETERDDMPAQKDALKFSQTTKVKKPLLVALGLHKGASCDHSHRFPRQQTFSAAVVKDTDKHHPDSDNCTNVVTADTLAVIPFKSSATVPITDVYLSNKSFHRTKTVKVNKLCTKQV